MTSKITRAVSVYAGWAILYLALAYVTGAGLIWAAGLHAELHSTDIRLAAGLMTIGIRTVIDDSLTRALEAYRA